MTTHTRLSSDNTYPISSVTQSSVQQEDLKCKQIEEEQVSEEKELIEGII